MLLASVGRRLPVPDRIANAPTLWPGLDLYMDAFVELSTCRSYIGMNGTAGPIPYLAIDRYAERIGLDDPDEFEYFLGLVRRLDDAFLKHLRENKDD